MVGGGGGGRKEGHLDRPDLVRLGARRIFKMGDSQEGESMWRSKARALIVTLCESSLARWVYFRVQDST